MTVTRRLERLLSWIPARLVIFIVVVLALLFFCFVVWVYFYDGSVEVIKLQEAAYYGNLLAGVFAFLSVVLIAFTLRYQSDAANLARFEDRFFDLLKIQRENSANICINPQEQKGRVTFAALFREIIAARKLVRRFCSRNEISPDESDIKERNVDNIKKYRRHTFETNLAFSVFYYGVKKSGSGQILDCILDKIPQFKSNAPRKLAFINMFNNAARKERETNPEYFNGQQIRLGHYFQHLYKTLTYVNGFDACFLDYRKRYGYAEMLRSQLSIYEQMVLFFYLVAEQGRKWELEEGIPENEELVTKYNFLADLADPAIYDINVKEFFPDMVFENDRESMCGNEKRSKKKEKGKKQRSNKGTGEELEEKTNPLSNKKTGEKFEERRNRRRKLEKKYT